MPVSPPKLPPKARQPRSLSKKFEEYIDLPWSDPELISRRPRLLRQPLRYAVAFAAPPCTPPFSRCQTFLLRNIWFPMKSPRAASQLGQLTRQ